jgi:hypothetical protein
VGRSAGEGDAHAPDLAGSCLARNVNSTINAFENFSRWVDECESCCGEAHASCGAQEEGSIEVLLELLDTPTQHRLSNIEHICCACEVELLGEENEGFQVL